MTKGQKALLGLLTVVPPIYLILVLLTPLRHVFTTSPLEASDWSLYFTAFHFFMYLYTALLLTFYLVHLFGNGSMSRERKVLWALLLMGGFVFTMPVYWYLQVWRKER